MAKYRVMQMTLTATHNGSAELTVIGSKLDGIEYASFKCTDKNTIMLVLDMYMGNPNDERVSTFEGEYVDVPLHMVIQPEYSQGIVEMNSVIKYIIQVVLLMN